MKGEMQLKKYIILGTLFISLAVLCPMKANAQVLREESNLSTEYNEGQISPRADVIEAIFRWNNGVIQYRRWNATWGYWVDPDWIDVE